MTRRAGLLVLAAALLQSGCVTTGPLEWIRQGFKVGPEYCRPPAPLAAEWVEGRQSAVLPRQLPDGAWWKGFQDPVLTDLIEAAFRQNLNLRTLGARVLEARAQQAIAVGQMFPQTQQATGSYSRVNLSKNAPNNPAVLISVLPQAALAGIPNSALPTPYFSEWMAGFNMSWELDFWGRFRRNVESANASTDAAVEDYDDALVTLLADVATNYVQFRVAQQRLKIARDNVRIQEAVVKLQEERFQGGIGTALDVAQLRTVLEQTRSTIPPLQIQQAVANNALCTLLGVPAHDLEPDLGPGPDLYLDPMPHTPGWVAAGIPADLIRRRPDLRAAERRVAAQSARIGVAEADLYPSFFINGTIGVEAQDIAKLFTGDSFTGTVMPAFRWNILNYGRILNNVRFQDVRTRELVAAYQNRVLTAQQEVENGLAGFLFSHRQAEDLSRGVEAATTATQQGLRQFRTGTIDLNRVFNLETTQVQVQDQLAVAQGNIALNLINVYRALGGGWEIRCPPDPGDGAAPDACKDVPPAPKAEPEADKEQDRNGR